MVTDGVKLRSPLGPQTDDERRCFDRGMEQWRASLKRPDMTEEDRVKGALEAYCRQAFALALSPPIKAGEAVPVAIETLLDELERGVVSTGLHEDNETELFDIDEAAEAMYQASVLIRVLCARTSPQPEAYGVRALEWGERQTNTSGDWTWSAKTSIGRYIASTASGERCKGSHFWFISGETISAWANSEDEAKAAAQADYSARILAALEPTP